MAPQSSPSPPRTRWVPALQLVRPFAAAVLLAVVFGRALSPSAVGMGVGLERITTALEWLGAPLSHLAAVLGSALILEELRVVLRVRSALGAPTSVACALGGFFVVVLSMAAIVARGRLPEELIAVAGLVAAVSLLASARVARRHAVLRPLPALFAAVGAAVLARLLAVGLASQAGRSAGWFHASRGAATLSFACEAGAVALTLGWLALRRRRVVSIATTAVLLLALIATRGLIATDPERVGPLGLLFARGMGRMLLHPEPFVPLSLRVFVVVLGLLVAALLLVSRVAFAGVAALVVAVRGLAEAPLGAEGLVVAAYAVLIVATDPRMLWSALPPAARRGPGTPTSEGDPAA